MRDAVQPPDMDSAYVRGILDEAKRAIGEYGHEGYAAKLDEYDGPKLATLLDVLSYKPFRRDILMQLYKRNGPHTACELRTEIGRTFPVTPPDLQWFGRHFYMRDEVLASKYDSSMVDRRALLRAKVQLRSIERDAKLALRRKQNETRTRKRRVWRLPPLR